VLEDKLRLLIASNPEGAAVRAELAAYLRDLPAEVVARECVEHLVEWLGTICTLYYELRRSATRTVDHILASQPYATVLGALSALHGMGVEHDDREVVAVIVDLLATVESRRGALQEAAREELAAAFCVALAYKDDVRGTDLFPPLEHATVMQSDAYRMLQHCKSLREILEVFAARARHSRRATP
jgi:hypothetical protein